MVDSGQTREHDHGGSRDGRKGHFCTKCVEAPPLYLATGRGFRFASSETLEIAPYLNWTMIEISLFLDTTPERFLGRLLTYVRNSRCQVIELKDALIVAPPGHEISPRKLGPLRHHTANIMFVVHELTSDRIEVDLYCGHPAYEGYFRHLLQKIEEWWPSEEAKRAEPPASPAERERELLASIRNKKRRERREHVLLLAKINYSLNDMAEALPAWSQRTLERDLEWLRDKALI